MDHVQAQYLARAAWHTTISLRRTRTRHAAFPPAGRSRRPSTSRGCRALRVLSTRRALDASCSRRVVLSTRRARDACLIALFDRAEPILEDGLARVEGRQLLDCHRLHLGQVSGAPLGGTSLDGRLRVEHCIRAATEEERQANTLACSWLHDTVLARRVIVTRQPTERVAHHCQQNQLARRGRLRLLYWHPQPVRSSKGLQAGGGCARVEGDEADIVVLLAQDARAVHALGIAIVPGERGVGGGGLDLT